MIKYQVYVNNNSRLINKSKTHLILFSASAVINNASRQESYFTNIKLCTISPFCNYSIIRY